MKQQLTEALAHHDDLRIQYRTHIIQDDSPIITAARLVERLLPGECRICYGSGWDGPPSSVDEFRRACERCYGVGQVWDEGIVEAVAKAIHQAANTETLWDGAVEPYRDDWRREARAVLSALVELLTEKVEK